MKNVIFWDVAQCGSCKNILEEGILNIIIALKMAIKMDLSGSEKGPVASKCVKEISDIMKYEEFLK
jgi:hypothetical protein